MPSERSSSSGQPPLRISQPVKNASAAPLQLPQSSDPTSSPSSLWSPSAPTPGTPRSRLAAGPSVDLTLACMLVVGVGCTLSWTAVVFGSAVYYSERYGRAALLYLSAAVYVPGVLVAVLHAAVDGWMYRRLGAVRWTQLRMCGGLLLVALLTLAIPCIPDDTSHTGEWLLYALTFSLGAACALPSCCSLDIASSLRKHYIVALTAGTQLSGLISLALTFLCGLNRPDADSRTHRLFLLSAALTTAASLGAAALLQWKSQPWHYVMGRRDFFSKRGSDRQSEATPLLAQQHLDGERWQLAPTSIAEGGEHQEDAADDTEPLVLPHSETVHNPAPTLQLARHIGDIDALPAQSTTSHSPLLATARLVWRPCVALFLTVASSVMLASLYSFTPSASPGLLLVLVYTRLTLDLVGRVVLLLPAVTHWLSHSSMSSAALLTAAIVRVAVSVPLFCAYLAGWLALSDGLVVVFVGLLSLSSGLMCTLSYQFAATSVSGANRSSAAHWMNLSFQSSILTGLLAGFIVRFTLLRSQ